VGSISEMEPTTKRGACAVVLDDDGRVLLVKRKDFRLWVLPGGGLEDGETAEAAAVRETAEETGYQIAIERYVGRYILIGGPLGRSETDCFVGRLIGGEAIENGPETAAVGWFDPGRLPRRFLDTHRLRLADALANRPEPVERILTVPLWQQWVMKALLALRNLRNRLLQRP